MKLVTNLLSIGYLCVAILCSPIGKTTTGLQSDNTIIEFTKESLLFTDILSSTEKIAEATSTLDKEWSTTTVPSASEVTTRQKTENEETELQNEVILALTSDNPAATSDSPATTSDNPATTSDNPTTTSVSSATTSVSSATTSGSSATTSGSSATTTDNPTTSDSTTTTAVISTARIDSTKHPKKTAINPPIEKPKCGRRFTRIPRIAGGEDSLAGEFPWAVSVRLLSTHHCGGIIINKDWILTAGHCTKRFAARYYRIRLGGFGVDIDAFRPMYDIKVSDVVIYPSFGSPARYSYDISLLKLARSITSREFGSPVCLPENLDETFEGRNVTVVGWGIMNAKSEAIANVLQQVIIPVINNSYCNQIYEEEHYAYIQVREFHICAGGKGKDSCKGDSGGPLVVLDEKGRYTLVGVVSAGLGCGELQLPGLYSRATYFAPWINEVTGGHTLWPPDDD